jgi:chromosome segregation ATPase
MDDADTKLDKLEERIRGTENALATLTANITLNTNNIKENMSRTQNDLGHRMDGLKSDMKENHNTVTDSVNSLNESLQNLYVSHSGAQNTVKFNEKLVWGIVGLIFTVGLYIIQDFIKVAGAG